MADLGVVMPVYIQKTEFLKAAMESVLNQSFRDFKLIVIIDGAPEMEPLVKSLVLNDERVEIISYSTNRGVAFALNTGFEELYKDNDIKYLTWVSTDNVYYHAFLETFRNTLMNGADELGLVYSSFQSMDNEGKALYDEFQLAALRKYQSKPKEKLLDSSIIGVSFMYKSKYAKMIDGYHMIPVEDYDYWLRITEHCEIRYIPVELMDYRVNSEFSVSATLQSSEQHRNWRYMYHLARYQARMRRNIKPLFTILFPVREANDLIIKRIENLYEQSFSNYYCYVLDLTPDQSVRSLLSAISHPTTDFIGFPNIKEKNALMNAMQMIQTPYTMVLDLRLFPDVSDLDVLLAELSKADSRAYSNFFTEDHIQVGYRFEVVSLMKSNIYSELFRTKSLEQLLRMSDDQ
ncbi:glycosyltransferase [Paenibacillus sp. Marseille-Q4541]|uniref:glycosyltransferase family 2 protein n=1 Tax=Paenibacillus sp. Marseille-Q4541 TaxID=2831522 RepID=UPI001BAB7C15|nr:glycosyltransferase [Paenibacillus sp. Marseille-Q4541]